MAAQIGKELAFVSPEEFGSLLADILRHNLPGVIYVETGDTDSEVFVITRNEYTAGIFSIQVRQAEIVVNDPEAE